MENKEIYHVVEKEFILADTNAWISRLNELKHFDNLVVIGAVLRELDKLKSSSNQELAFQSREASRYIKENKNKFKFDLEDYNAEEILGKSYDNSYADNRIVACAYKNNYKVISDDLNVQFKALGFGLDIIEINERITPEEDYKGFIEVEMTQDEYKDFHDNRLGLNEFNLLINQYLIVYNSNTELDEFGHKEPIQAFKWDGQYYIHTKQKVIKSRYVDDFKSRDLYQDCAIDSVMNNSITLLRGKAGTAKTQIAICYGLQQLQSGKINKLIIFANNFPSRDAFYNGLVKGDLQQKLRQSSIGNILISKLGSYELIEAMLITEELMILPASDIRGFDSNGMNALIILTEAQNWSNDLMKLGIQRLGEDCKMIIEGDNTTQLDVIQFGGMRNGMRIASYVFRGLNYYGEVELQNIYRSPMASRAELMTDIEFLSSLN